MLRGSIGSVTYTTKKTKSGKTEQIARQKAQSVTNPQTTAQILQRMLLKTSWQRESFRTRSRQSPTEAHHGSTSFRWQ